MTGPYAPMQPPDEYNSETSADTEPETWQGGNVDEPASIPMVGQEGGTNVSSPPSLPSLEQEEGSVTGTPASIPPDVPLPADHSPGDVPQPFVAGNLVPELSVAGSQDPDVTRASQWPLPSSFPMPTGPGQLTGP